MRHWVTCMQAVPSQAGGYSSISVSLEVHGQPSSYVSEQSTSVRQGMLSREHIQSACLVHMCAANCADRHAVCMHAVGVSCATLIKSCAHHQCAPWTAVVGSARAKFLTAKQPLYAQHKGNVVQRSGERAGHCCMWAHQAGRQHSEVAFPDQW